MATLSPPTFHLVRFGHVRVEGERAALHQRPTQTSLPFLHRYPFHGDDWIALKLRVFLFCTIAPYCDLHADAAVVRQGQSSFDQVFPVLGGEGKGLVVVFDDATNVHATWQCLALHGAQFHHGELDGVNLSIICNLINLGCFVEDKLIAMLAGIELPVRELDLPLAESEALANLHQFKVLLRRIIEEACTDLSALNIKQLHMKDLALATSVSLLERSQRCFAGHTAFDCPLRLIGGQLTDWEKLVAGHSLGSAASRRR
mmetsp:Transcript_89177/g.212947  ORF Transcript_89177/g.212947 Transcript_89177/m.212947 type:complete len:258 (-) Transcript_89177:30-803(-)